MLLRKVQRLHKSKAVVIPSHVCDLVGIGFGDQVEFKVEGEKIIITPAPEARQDYTRTEDARVHPECTSMNDISLSKLSDLTFPEYATHLLNTQPDLIEYWEQFGDSLRRGMALTIKEYAENNNIQF